MLGTILSVLGLAFAAWAVGLVFTIISKKLTGSGIIPFVTMYSTTTAIALYFTELWSLSFFVVALSPIVMITIFVTVVAMVATVFVSIFGFVLHLLAPRGYLGNTYKWIYEIEDERAQEAIEMLDYEELSNIASVSADAEDFKENVIEEAGVGDEIPTSR